MKRIHDEREIRSTRGFGHVKSHYAAIRSFAAAPAAAYDTLLQKGAPAFFAGGFNSRPSWRAFCPALLSNAFQSGFVEGWMEQGRFEKGRGWDGVEWVMSNSIFPRSYVPV